MNYFIEGLQGSGKSTALKYITELHTELIPVREGDYSPVELAWCAYVTEALYMDILDRYPDIRNSIEEKTYAEGDMRIVCYTKVHTDDRNFYSDLEGYEIYNGRRGYDEFKDIILSRYRRWNSDGMAFECSLFQNTVEDMILFRNASDDDIIDLYRDIKAALEGKDYRIIYLEADSIPDNLAVIRKERSDENGNELWFPMLLGFFDNSPYAKAHGVSGEDALIAHLQHRQALELRICRELFPERTTVLRSKKYSRDDLI